MCWLACGLPSWYGCWLACGLPNLVCVLAGMWPAMCVGWHEACLLSMCVGWHVAVCVLAGMWPTYLVCGGWLVPCLLSICVGWHVACLLSMSCVGWHVACLLSMCVGWSGDGGPASQSGVRASDGEQWLARLVTSLRTGDVSGAWCSGGPQRWPGARRGSAGRNCRCSLLLWQTWGLQLIWDWWTQCGWTVLWLLSQFQSVENHRSSPWG